MRTKLTESLVSAIIVLVIVAAILIPTLLALAHFTPIALPLLLDGTKAVALVAILVGILGGW